jgi:N-acyl-D-amino-acid deacylase
MRPGKLDLLIKNGRIADGTGNPSYRADVGISKGRIACIGRGINKGEAKRVIDAADLIVSPGFLDAHSHDDAYLFVNPQCDEKVLQGVTTDVIGSCGLSMAPVIESHRVEFQGILGALGGENLAKEFWRIKTFNDFLLKLAKARPGINVVPLVGHGTIRIAAMGMEKRPPTDAELKKMKRLMAEAMKSGAYGLSTALILAPASYAQTDEVIELAKIAGRYKGVFTIHLRSESDHIMEALEEALRIGREADVPVEIVHHKAAGKENWGKSIETLARLEKARAAGVDVTCDQYPYPAGSLFLAAALPPSIQEGGPEVYAEKLKDPMIRSQVMDEIEKSQMGQWESMIRNCGFEGIVIASSNHGNYVGKSLAEIAKMEGKNPYDIFFDLVIEEKTSTKVILWMMDEEDIKRIMKNPLTMIGTDGIPGFGKNKFHPRMTGTFPRVLGHYVRKEGLIPLEEAIRKMTSLTAQTFGVKNKGLLKEGFDADLVVFDRETIIDKATFENPAQKPEGIEWVLVNGEVAVEKGEVAGAKSGRVLRHNFQIP